jgi:hypothetical protein
MWYAVAALDGDSIIAAAYKYEDVLDRTREWLGKHGDDWFDELPDIPAREYETYHMEELGIPFVEADEPPVDDPSFTPPEH